MHEEGLLEKVRSRTRDLLDTTYFPEAEKMDDLVVGPGLGDAAGVSGPSCSRRNLSGGDLHPESMAILAGRIRTGR